MKAKHISGIGAAVGMLILILDGKTALSGAQEGINLCIQAVIPSLFPFFVLSILLTGSFSGTELPLLRPIGKFCGISKGAESLLIPAFLGGYPVGAQCISSSYRSGQLTKPQAERLLAFCNNAGPSFLFGIVAAQFPDSRCAWLLWGIHLLSALLTARTLPAVENFYTEMPSGGQISLTDALMKALRVMASVCGWVVLFRVVIAFLNRWILWLLPKAVQILVIGLLELTNGCCSLALIENTGLRFLICSGILAFGGICVTMQTVTVTKGLDMKLYFAGKALQALYSVGLAGILQTLIFGRDSAPIPTPFLLFSGALLIFPFLLRKKQKNSSIPAASGV